MEGRRAALSHPSDAGQEPGECSASPPCSQHTSPARSYHVLLVTELPLGRGKKVYLCLRVILVPPESCTKSARSCREDQHGSTATGTWLWKSSYRRPRRGAAPSPGAMGQQPSTGNLLCHSPREDQVGALQNRPQSTFGYRQTHPHR